MITRKDVFIQCELAKDSRDKTNNVLYDHGGPTRDMYIAYYCAYDIWISWCNVLSSIDHGVDPTIAVLQREVGAEVGGRRYWLNLIS